MMSNKKVKKQKDHTNGDFKDLMFSGLEKGQLNDDMAALPRIILTDRQLCDLELLLNGGFYPLEGFLTEEEYLSVLEKRRLPNGAIWPMPIVLDVNEEGLVSKGDTVLLCDKYTKPLAVMEVDSVYKPDKKKEAKAVYGTTDTAHFGVQTLFEQTGNLYIGGKVQGITLPEYSDFNELRHTPKELRKILKEKGWDKVVGFQTRNPMHRAHFEIVKRAAQEIGGKALIHPVVGLTKTGDINYMTRVRSYKKVHENYASDFAAISLLPLAMRMAGPVEALWHALIRKNYGCTHFIIGRDHAGPGKDSKGVPFYGMYDAQDLVKEHEEEIGIKLVTPKEMVFVEEKNKYFPFDEVKKTYNVKNISGTQLRGMLEKEEEIPEWFSFPEVIEEIKKGAKREKNRGVTLFFTGLSGSGKSTIALLLNSKLQESQEKETTLLDGDIVRLNLSKGLGFSHEDRNTNIERIGFVASEVVRHGGIAICAAIAPYEESRKNNRERISELGSYIEVYISTPIEVCKERDVKGLYKKAEKGLIKGFTGVDDPYEKPKNAEIVLDTTNKTSHECVEIIFEYLKSHNLISNNN